MSLADQLREVTGREVEVLWEYQLMELIGRGKSMREWRQYLDRYTDQIDFREVLEGKAELGSFPLIVANFRSGGLFLEFRRPNEVLHRLRKTAGADTL
jgi:hypothetical protein